ncbi:hypothetical protein [Streptomyces sp. NBC_01565]|uniref:hypothetical protein n=1 Tax=Streptomyces sp. NBC_01565 TaxID=2975881 RepID=UPI00225ACCE9|nr:hypothetical protein [Streptomyces sp. NBC_01565]MCX4546444.1 hypothetical protein [Streptomyces sp. NBC_01565]
MSTITTRTAPDEPSESAAQELARLRRQRDALIVVLGAVLALGALLAVRIAPSWADPAQVGIGTAGIYAAVVLPYLRRR